MNSIPLATFGAAALLAAACSRDAGTSTDPMPARESFGKIPAALDPAQPETHVFTLTNANGLKARVSDFGATLVSLEVPDRDGKLADVTHGFDSVEGYAGPMNPYFGASVGRYGNRIAKGKFTLGEKTYQLATNNDVNHLHGGDRGFNKRLWTVKSHNPPNSITFAYVSPDGEEGYPGTLTAEITYELTDDNELIWTATATTDAETIVNLVHHSYWNLSGDPSTPIADHVLTLPASKFLPTDSTLIPTGRFANVADTPMDFRAPTPIGQRVEADFEALKLGGGYDHCWILDQASAKPGEVILAARLHDPESGRTMEVSSNQPGIQFYGGNFLEASQFQGENPAGKGGVAYPYRSALCLETQIFPDSPNQDGFTDATLSPGETYRHVMVHKFSAE